MSKHAHVRKQQNHERVEQRVADIGSGFSLVVANLTVIQGGPDEGECTPKYPNDGLDVFHRTMRTVGGAEGLEIAAEYNDCVVFSGDRNVLEDAAAYIEEHHSLCTGITRYDDLLANQYSDDEIYEPPAQ